MNNDAAPEAIEEEPKTSRVDPIPIERWVDLVRGPGDAYLVDDVDIHEELMWERGGFR